MVQLSERFAQHEEIFSMKRIACSLFILAVGSFIVSCGSGSDPLMIGDAGEDTQSDAAAGSGGSSGSGGTAGTAGTGGTAQGGGDQGGQAGTGGGDAGTGGDPKPDCQENDGDCFDGVYRACVNGKWGKETSCVKNGLYCSPTNGCVDKCETDNQCEKHDDKVNGQYCRKDGRCSPRLFETVWKIPNNDKMLVLPYFDDGKKSACNFKILWGDEQDGTDITKTADITDCKIKSNRTHTYKNAGEYHVKILGTYNGWGVSIQGTTPELTLKRLSKVVSFGPVGLTQYAFNEVGNIELPEKDIPDPTNWTNAVGLFYKANEFNRPLNHWDMSNITNMSAMFNGTETFDQPLNMWNVSSVEDMSSMFNGAKTFDHKIGDWNVQKVTNMLEMFKGARKFNQPLKSWIVSNVKSMVGMFADAEKFNQDLSAWKLDNDVELNNIFQNSGMTKENYCLLKGLSVWSEHFDDLGLSENDCPP